MGAEGSRRSRSAGEREGLHGGQEQTQEKEVKGAAGWDSLWVPCTSSLPRTEGADCFQGCRRGALVKDKRKKLIACVRKCSK